MKAAVIREHGGPEVIRVEDLPEPHPGPREVVVDVRAGALNHLDIWVRVGGRTALQFPHVIGSDAAGVVAAVGAQAEGVEVGQEVVVVAGYRLRRLRVLPRRGGQPLRGVRHHRP